MGITGNFIDTHLISLLQASESTLASAHLGTILRSDLTRTVRPKLCSTHPVKQGHMIQKFSVESSAEATEGHWLLKAAAFIRILPVSGYKCINTHQTLSSSLTQLCCYCRASAMNNWSVKSLALMRPSLTLLSRSAYMTHSRPEVQLNSAFIQNRPVPPKKEHLCTSVFPGTEHSWSPGFAALSEQFIADNLC